MKKKTKQLIEFLDQLHDYIETRPTLRSITSHKSETAIQTEIRPIILRYLENYFEERGYKDAEAKSNRAFYWEGEPGSYGRGREKTFGSRNYPDFIIKDPYLIAIEYKKDTNGSTVKRGIGQSIMYTISGDFHYVYYLFQDESNNHEIYNSYETGSKEKKVLNLIWNNFNVFLKVLDPKKTGKNNN